MNASSAALLGASRVNLPVTSPKKLSSFGTLWKKKRAMFAILCVDITRCAATSCDVFIRGSFHGHYKRSRSGYSQGMWCGIINKASIFIYLYLYECELFMRLESKAVFLHGFF